jgi:peroxiredoxin Q/BCP
MSTQDEWIGKPAPDFSLPDQHGNTVSLKDFKGKNLVVFFYPKDSTPGCTKEACGFRDTKRDFEAAGAEVLSISILTPASKAKFAEKHNLNYPLLSDEDSKVASAYGVWKEKSMYGKTYMGISRETFVIGSDRKVRMHWPKASGSESHAVEVLDWLKENS